MLLTFSKPRLLAFSKPTDLFYPILFLYFLTLHADVLSLTLKGFTFRYNNFIAFALIVALMLRFRREFFSIDKRITIPLLMLTASLLISFFFSSYKRRCFLFFGWYGLTMICYFWLPYQIMHKLDVKKVLKLYFWSFIGVGLFAVKELGHFFQTHLRERPHAFTYEPSYYALYMTPFIVMVNFYYLFLQEKKRMSLKLLLFINFLFMISFSTSAFVTYLFFGIAIFLLSFLSEFKPYRKK